MMNSPKIFFLFITIGLTISLYAQKIEWVSSTWGNIRGKIIIAENDDIFISGTYHHIYSTINGVSLNNLGYGSEDMFLARYNSHGELIWVRTSDSDGDVQGHNISTDRHGNTVVVGRFKGEVWFEDRQLIAEIDRTNFMVKYNADGNIVWVERMTGGNDVGKIKTDYDGNIYILNALDYPLLIGDTILYDESNIYGWKITLMKFNSDGKYLWHKTATDNIFPGQLQLLSNGDAIVSGIFHEFVSWVPGDTTWVFENAPHETDAYLSRISKDGEHVWTEIISGKDYQQIYEIEVDKLDNIYIAGKIDAEPFSIGEELFDADTTREIIIAKWNEHAQLQWINNFKSETSRYRLPKLAIQKEGLPVLFCNDNDKYNSDQYNGLRMAHFAAESGKIVQNILYKNHTYYNEYLFDSHFDLITFGGTYNGTEMFDSIIYPTEQIDMHFTKIKMEPFSRSFDTDFIVYPNPANEGFTLHYSTGKIDSFSLKIYSIDGKLVLAETLNNLDLWEYYIPVNNWKSGVYIGEITQLNVQKTFKLVVL